MKVEPGPIIGYCPRQMWGSVDGKRFYMRLRGDVSFRVSHDPEVKPEDIDYTDEKGFCANEFTHPHLDKCDRTGYPGWADDDEVMACLDAAVEAYQAHLAFMEKNR